MSDDPWQDPDRDPEERLDHLIGLMSTEEACAQVLHVTPAVERIGLPARRFGGESIHGFARQGRATVFPQAIALAATWNTDLHHRIATAISDEIRAYHNVYRKHPDKMQPVGLVTWAPNINLIRDPRWGRSQETYSEDPCLTARFAVAFIRGMQGDDPTYIKVSTGVKHFAIHSGPEAERHKFDARPSARDLFESYLPHFRAAFIEGGSTAVMTCYNVVYGEPGVASRWMLGDLLRTDWGFDGMILSDGGSFPDLHGEMQVTANEKESAAYAVSRGCDLELGRCSVHLPEAIEEGLVSEDRIREAARTNLRMSLRLGLLDPEDRTPWKDLPPETINHPDHRALARQAAAESTILLKNDGVLPLARDVGRIFVTGRNAARIPALTGNYTGYAPRMTTPLEGITAAMAPTCSIHYEPGWPLNGPIPTGMNFPAMKARHRDAVIAVMGLGPELEGEEYDPAEADHLGDRLELDLPQVQAEYLRPFVENEVPLILVLVTATPLALPDWLKDGCAAIITQAYSGEAGGEGLADILFGDANPSGRLTLTWPKHRRQLPPFTEYAMKDRGYRFMRQEPQWPFGYGLSYTTFAYSELQAPESLATGDDLELAVKVTNAGDRPGQEVVQVYLEPEIGPEPRPHRRLVAFRKVAIEPGQSTQVGFTIPAAELAVFQDNGDRVALPGTCGLTVGGSQGDPLSLRLTGSDVLRAQFSQTGEARVLEPACLPPALRY